MGKANNPKRKKQEAVELFAGMLNQAKAHRDRIDGFKLSKAKMSNKNWLAVVGAGAKTRVRFRVIKSGNRPFFISRRGLGAGPSTCRLKRFRSRHNLLYLFPIDNLL